MSLVRSIVRYADGQNGQTLRQRIGWKIYINLIIGAVWLESKFGFVAGFLV